MYVLCYIYIPMSFEYSTFDKKGFTYDNILLKHVFADDRVRPPWEDTAWWDKASKPQPANFTSPLRQSNSTLKPKP